MEYKNYKEHMIINVQVVGIVYVPGKMMAGLCFPKAHVEGPVPHMGLILWEGWDASLAMAVVHETCLASDKFQKEYNYLKSVQNKADYKQFSTKKDNIVIYPDKINKQNNILLPRVYFIAFGADKLIEFEGDTKKYY